MLAGLFRSNQTAVLLAVPLVVAAFFLPALWHPGPVSQLNMPIAGLVESLCAGTPWLRELIGLVLVGLLAAQLALLVNGVELMGRPNHLVALIFPLILAGLSTGPVYEPALLGMPWVVMAMRRAWSVPNTGPVLARLFDTGLLIALAAFCYLPYAFLLIAVWAGVSLVRPFAWREYAVPTVALALAFYLCWAVLHLAGHTPWRPFLTMGSQGWTFVLTFNAAQRWFLSLGGLLLLFALPAFANDHRHSVMRGKNIRSAFLAFVFGTAVIAVLPWFMLKSFSPTVVAVPISVLCGYALLRPRKALLAEIVVLGLTGLALWGRWG